MRNEQTHLQLKLILRFFLLCFSLETPFTNSTDISSKTKTWPISNTEYGHELGFFGS